MKMTSSQNVPVFKNSSLWLWALQLYQQLKPECSSPEKQKQKVSSCYLTGLKTLSREDLWIDNPAEDKTRSLKIKPKQTDWSWCEVFTE